MITQQKIIIGANSDIAKAIFTKIIASPNTNVILISRDLADYPASDSVQTAERIKKIQLPDYQSQSIEQAISEIPTVDDIPITGVFICNGLLHSNTITPEKRIEDIDASAFEKVMTANALTPMLWIQKLTPLISGKSSSKVQSKCACKLVVLSARVGSISDNRLGGWYTYRASKAALNMMLKNTAIEFARRAKNIKIIAFHPGTTDTPLSKPFQKNVPSNKLFTSDFVADQLLSIVENTAIDQTASYVDWQGEVISW